MSLLIIFFLFLTSTYSTTIPTSRDDMDQGRSLLEAGQYEAAGLSFWSAIMKHDQSIDINDIQKALELFLLTYQKRNIPEEGFLTIGKQFIQQGMIEEGVNYITTSLSLNEHLVDGHLILMKVHSSPPVRMQHMLKALELDPNGYATHYAVGNELFSLGSWDSSLAMFEKAYSLNSTCWHSLSSLIYLRSHVCKWGHFGSQYQHDMNAIEQIIREEAQIKEAQKLVKMKSPSLSIIRPLGEQQSVNDVEWIEHDEASLSASSIHTHMLLGYDIPSELKLKVARMHTEYEQSLVRRSGLQVYSHDPQKFKKEKENSSNFRIKIGYVSANIKSKTTVYMAQDLFRFHNRDKFEVHVYATTPNDNPTFIQNAMGGVDWREKVKNSVEFFHDVSGIDVNKVADLIRDHNIHILVDWDGHSNNMIRLSGLFPMQTAPLQVGHQEFIGTNGASYIQYLITDKIASPHALQYLYSEKFIYMPHTFLANSMAYLSPHIMPPKVKRDHGSNIVDEEGAVSQDEKLIDIKDRNSSNKSNAINNPQLNGCGGLPADFVYCNFNKHLKFSPNVFRSWLTILQNVDNSVLCLLHNPQDSEKYLMTFVNEFDESLASRVRFLPFVASPFDNQKRVSHMCNAVLDTPIYNGHTCSVDALWGGVPVVVYGNTVEMASRVGMSMMSTLGLPELIARDQDDYNEIAIRLADDEVWYRSIRRRLVNTCYENNPKNPLWDLEQYVKDLEMGFEMIWENFLTGNVPQNADISAYKKHIRTSSGDVGMGAWMVNASKQVRTKKKGSLKPLLQYVKEKKKSSRPLIDRGGQLHTSLQGVTQGLWDILSGLDEAIIEALNHSDEEEIAEVH